MTARKATPATDIDPAARAGILSGRKVRPWLRRQGRGWWCDACGVGCGGARVQRLRFLRAHRACGIDRSA